MEEMILEVDWDSIRVSPFQPRRVFSEEELHELADSIKAIGLIHLPVVRKITNQGKFLYYELIAGERRWRAAKKAGLSKLKVVVRESSDEDAAKATLIENVQRVDLDPLETARAFKKLIEVFRMTQEEVSDKVGKKRSTVANYLRLLALPQEIQEGLSKGIITMGHAKALLSLDSKDLQHSLHELIVRHNLTVREAEKESSKLNKDAKKRKRAASKQDVHVREIEEQLQEALQTKVSINHTEKKGGVISISYYSLEDLEKIANQMIPS